MSPQIPRPRSSGHTQVGLGAVEARNGNGDITPPSGVDLETLEAGVMYLGEQVKRLADEEHRAHTVIARAAAHAEMAEQSADNANEAIRAVRDEVEGIKLALLGEVLPALQRQASHVERIVELQKAVVALDQRLGQPPGKLDQRASQVGELTASEIADLEREGTGLFAVVGRIVANQARLIKRVGFGAAAAAAGAPLAVEVVKWLLGGG